MTAIRSVFSPYVTNPRISRETSLDVRVGGRHFVRAMFYTTMGTVSTPQL